MWWASEGSDTPQTPQGNDLTRVRWFLWDAVSLLFKIYSKLNINQFHAIVINCIWNYQIIFFN